MVQLNDVLRIKCKGFWKDNDFQLESVPIYVSIYCDGDYGGRDANTNWICMSRICISVCTASFSGCEWETQIQNPLGPEPDGESRERGEKLLSLSRLVYPFVWQLCLWNLFN
jgi:hypothetical protein